VSERVRIRLQLSAEQLGQLGDIRRNPRRVTGHQSVSRSDYEEFWLSILAAFRKEWHLAISRRKGGCVR
jgi:hypothetical protein